MNNDEIYTQALKEPTGTPQWFYLINQLSQITGLEPEGLQIILKNCKATCFTARELESCINLNVAPTKKDDSDPTTPIK